jgi:hypoxanthine phosphoribosyltransferase
MACASGFSQKARRLVKEQRLRRDIIDCIGTDFDEACMSLLERVNALYSPDLFIGIESGGGEILRRMRALGSDDLGSDDMTCAFVRASRDGSAAKKRYRVKSLLAILPRGVNNLLRAGEHGYRAARFAWRRQAGNRNVVVGEAERGAILKGRVICLVDDAVDTGASAIAVRQAILAVNPDARIVVACIVQTFDKPMLVPDVVLYRQVLIRFPWSEDA